MPCSHKKNCCYVAANTRVHNAHMQRYHGIFYTRFLAECEQDKDFRLHSLKIFEAGRNGAYTMRAHPRAGSKGHEVSSGHTGCSLL